MTAALVPLSMTPVFDNDGNVSPGAMLYFYKTGTLDPITVYQDHVLGAPFAQPVVTGGSARIPPIYVGDEFDYRVRILDKYGSLIEDIPFLPAATASEGEAPPAADTAWEVGDVVWRYATGGVRAGWVRANGGSIGSPLSPASEHANENAHDLFLWLWGQDAGINLLAVTNGRGASAESDWLANKAIDLPDMRGRVTAGVAGMGRTPVDRLANATFIAGNTAQVGATGGAATHTLTVGEIAPHLHPITDPGHAHAASQAAHAHPLMTNDNGHTHAVNDPSHAHNVYDPSHTHLFSPSAILSADSYGLQLGSPHYEHRVVISPGQFEAQEATTYATANTSIYAASTNISLQSATTGLTVAMGSVTPGITVNTNPTGITVDANEGGGAAHNNAQPFILGTWYMRL